MYNIVRFAASPCCALDFNSRRCAVPSNSPDFVRFEIVGRLWPGTRAVILIAALVAVAAVSGAALPLVVSNAPKPCIASQNVYKTIQAAVNAASPGATIDVCPGTYPEQVVITISLTLTGVKGGKADNPVVTVPAGGAVSNATVSPRGTAYPTAAQLLIQNTTGVTVQGLAVDGSNSGLTNCNTGIVGIYYQNASGTVNSVSVQNQVGFTNCGRGLGVYVETDGSASSTVTIENSNVRFTSGLNIGATQTGTTVTISGDSVVGSTISLDNGVYFARGAVGTVANNSIINFIYPPDKIGDLADAICGIQITKSSNITITGNNVGNTDCPIALAKGTNNTITNNKLVSTVNNDGVYVCGNGNIVQHNTIIGSDDSGIRLDNSAANFCTGFGNGNTITQNVINGTCVGILEPAGTTGNVVSPNTFSNVGILKSGSICPSNSFAVEEGLVEGAHPL